MIPPQPPPFDRLTNAIRKGIETEIELIIGEEAKAASKRVEERVRGRVGQIAAHVLERFTLEQFGTHLRITVDFANTIESPKTKP